MTPLLTVDHLSVHFTKGGGLFGTPQTLRAVNDVSLEMQRGETLAVVGESGSGKSTLGLAVAGLRKPTHGSIAIDSERSVDVLHERVRMIFQDPFAAIDPRMIVEDIVGEPLRLAGVSRTERRERVAQALEEVGMPADTAQRYPHQFSGGQRQRIAIARALIGEPELIIADEPLSALDVSIQSKIVNLMVDIRQRRQISYFFVSHDFGVVRHLADQVAVLYLGQLMEVARAERIFATPSHPYTQALLDAVPRIGTGRRARSRTLAGEVPSPLNPPSGCVFHPRCPKATAICAEVRPEMLQAPGRDGQFAACHHKD
jgi:oligopeptide/dipeptide ABC transporter ATP-binding protein